MVGEQLAAWRETLGITQEEAARRAGVPRRQYWKVEHDHVVTTETLQRVIAALKPPVLTIGETSVFPEGAYLESIRKEALSATESLQRLVALIDEGTVTAQNVARAARDADERLQAMKPPAKKQRPFRRDAFGRNRLENLDLEDPVVKTLLELLEAHAAADNKNR